MYAWIRWRLAINFLFLWSLLFYFEFRILRLKFLIWFIKGVVGIAWCGIFMYLTSNSPKNHHFITRAEREYIAAKISPINSENSNRKIPWSLIIKSKACLALFSR